MLRLRRHQMRSHGQYEPEDFDAETREYKRITRNTRFQQD